MDEQFGGRTDDDLFYEDFEPVVHPPVISTEAPSGTPGQYATSNATVPAPHRPANTPASNTIQPSSRSLASPRFADKPAPTSPDDASIVRNATANETPRRDVGSTTSSPSVDAGTSGDHHHPPHKPPRVPSQNTAASAEARLKSGANPRQKLTDDELAAKMERMKLLAAEKTRKFQMAEKDERQHAEAYARGMEEARRRRADEDRRGFQGANGGVRGARSTGLPGSRFAGDPADRPNVDRFLDERHGGRGRGGGQGSRGARGGARGGATPSDRDKAAEPSTAPALPPGPSVSDKADAPAGQAPPALALPSPPPEGGKWDEMEALDAVGKDT